MSHGHKKRFDIRVRCTMAYKRRIERQSVTAGFKTVSGYIRFLIDKDRDRLLRETVLGSG